MKLWIDLLGSYRVGGVGERSWRTSDFVGPVGQALAVELVHGSHRGPDRVQAGADVFLDDCRGDLEGDDVFDDHAGGWNGTNVRPLVRGGGRRLGDHVDRRPACGQGADRFLGGTDDDRLTVGRPPFDSAGVVGGTAEAEPAVLTRVIELVAIGVHHLRAWSAGRLEAEPDLHPLDGLYAHHRRRQPGVEL